MPDPDKPEARATTPMPRPEPTVIEAPPAEEVRRNIEELKNSGRREQTPPPGTPHRGSSTGRG
ncbi:MAG: hypothetical protein CYG60_20735 [Actinobacteria bacterium]|nr:MAG: hypothetical protein CYG60_20735 [Actinomycetota bacterium]